MEKKKETSPPQDTVHQNKKSQSLNYSAVERAKAVLSLWTESRKPSEICKELQIKYAILSFWQNRAMEGMLQALEPRVNLEKGPALSPRLQRFLDKRVNVQKKENTNSAKLTQRLQKIQSSRTAKNVSSIKK